MRNYRLQLIGWGLFMASGVIFFVQGVRAGDWLTVAGAVAWMVGVVFFVVGMT